MYINFYREKLDYAISIPVLAYKINTFTKGKKGDIDVLGDAIINLISEGEKLDIDNITRLIGIPYKYRKLVEYEVNELLDGNKIKVDSNNIIESKSKEDKSKEEFYVLYDKENNTFLNCIIPAWEFKKRYLVYENFDRDKSYYLNTNIKNKDINRYTICYKIQELITKSNIVSNIDLENNPGELDLFEYNNENDIFIRPFYEIRLDTVENIENPIEADFLIKAYINQKQEIEIEDPFTGDNTSVYIQQCVQNRLDKGKLIKLLNNNNEFMQIDKCSKKAKVYFEEYKQIDNNKERLNYIERISLYKELLLLDSNIYKNFGLATIEIEKVVKSRLKDIVDKFKKSKTPVRNISISGLCLKNELDFVEDIKIVQAIKNYEYKLIQSEKKIINIIGESSISSYLKCIYMSKYFTKDNYEEEVFKLFTSDSRVVKFLNDIWLYRNNTSHNIEKNKYFYNSEYDMDVMYKERLLEVTQDLMTELIYFVDAIKLL